MKGICMSTELNDFSYVLGQQIGNDLKNQEIEVDFDTFFDSIKGAYTGAENKFSPEENQMIMAKLQNQLQDKSAERAAKARGENIVQGQAYLEENGKKEGVTTTASGLQYRVLEAGNGNSPKVDSTVETHYEGKLIDGTVFDSSYQRGETTSFPVNQVIAGWTEALQLMKEGDVWELVIPAALAYGTQGAGGLIGPQATLVFKVELVKVL